MNKTMLRPLTPMRMFQAGGVIMIHTCFASTSTIDFRLFISEFTQVLLSKYHFFADVLFYTAVYPYNTFPIDYVRKEAHYLQTLLGGIMRSNDI